MAGVLRRALVPATRRLLSQIARPIASQASSRAAAHVGAGSGGRCGGWSMRSPPLDIPFAVKGLQHIAIAVPDLTAAAERYRSAFGAQVSEAVDHPDLMVTKVFVVLPNVCIELLHPLGEGPLAEFLRANPSGGIHHVSLTVDSVTQAQGYLGEAGVGSLATGMSSAMSGSKSAMFLQPKDTMGVLIELQQASSSQPRV